MSERDPRRFKFPPDIAMFNGQADNTMKKMHEMRPDLHPIRVSLADPVTGETIDFYAIITNEVLDDLLPGHDDALVKRVAQKVKKSLTPKRRGRRRDAENRDYEMWVLRYIEKLTYREIAEKIGIRGAYADGSDAIDLVKKAVKRFDNLLEMGGQK